ncbi:alpha and gamma adaptin binding protein p34-domain-containing protein [Aspergillus minisclerotigenes]|uniref:Alpha and gamma adaptin binding protein p34-domain-containing protein n=1 Tax=Aspergillus minisclerotigenes TaxID=656917 RepID=A0A5N6J497_9EURO|nr:alpha and gamma adaptin binding protein p34-domain-containing protein [Aspergillus minisclerotigenes]
MPEPSPHPRKQDPTIIPNPRRLLILTPSQHSHTTIPPFLHSLTGTPVVDPPTSTIDQKPDTDSKGDTTTTTTTTTTFAGYTTHPPLKLENRYYKAEVPIWVDEIPLDNISGDVNANVDIDTQHERSGLNPEDKEGQGEGDPLTPKTWQKEFSGPEAKVVRDAIGGVVICLRNLDLLSPSASTSTSTSTPTEQDVEEIPEWKGLKTFLEAVGSVKGVMDEERGGLGDVLGLVVLVGRGRESGVGVSTTSADPDEVHDLGEEEVFSVPWWEDKLFDLGLVGFEVVNWDPREVGLSEERDRFGEYQGMRRVREILETHDWASTPSGESGGVDDVEDELEGHLLEDGFDLEVDELEREMAGLRFAIENGGDDLGGIDGDDEIKVESMEALMLRMKAIKDMSDELPESERKRFAAKAVRDIMMEL